MTTKSRYGIILLPFAIAIIVLFALLTFLQKQGTLASSGIVYVAPGGDCGAASPCFGVIQSAIDYVSSGDMVKVATGSYTQTNNYGDTTQVVYINKSLILTGGYTISNWDTVDPIENPTIINAQHEGRGVFITGIISATVDGFEIMGGNAEDLGGGIYRADGGGGIYVISATVNLKNNYIYNNITNTPYGGGTGGGILLNASTAFLTNNTIANNDTGTSGIGGIVQGFFCKFKIKCFL